MNPDRRLIDRTVAGDLMAFEALVERHRDIGYSHGRVCQSLP
jgi:hypothetical protein